MIDKAESFSLLKEVPTRWANSIPMLMRPSVVVVNYFQRSSSKPLVQSKPDLMCNLHGKRERFRINGPGKMTKMASQPIHCKNLMVLKNKLWHCIVFGLFYDKLKTHQNSYCPYSRPRCQVSVYHWSLVNRHFCIAKQDVAFTLYYRQQRTCLYPRNWRE